MGKRTRGCWVRSSNTTSVLCSPLVAQYLFHDRVQGYFRLNETNSRYRSQKKTTTAAFSLSDIEILSFMGKKFVKFIENEFSQPSDFFSLWNNIWPMLVQMELSSITFFSSFLFVSVTSKFQSCKNQYFIFYR